MKVGGRHSRRIVRAAYAETATETKAMGYTHYFTLATEIEPETWAKITTDTQKLLDHIQASGTVLQYEYDYPHPPAVDEDHIRFNGAEEDGHETFFLDRTDTSFQFCKTAAKPYDLAVCGVLVILNHYVGESGADINSDGIPADWAEAVQLVRLLFGYGDLPHTL